MKNEKTKGAISTPVSVRIDVCSLCQLQCPLCPGARDETGTAIGLGYLTYKTFKAFIDNNPKINWVELASSGEVFLNPDLSKILEYAHAKKIITTINEGANLNYATEEVLEALVKYETKVVRCAIDGVTQETYATYRIGGNLKNAITNIQKINAYKKKYRSSKPVLIFQFIIFGHNEHELENAAILARMLKMKIVYKHNWLPERMPVKNPEHVSKYIGYADRNDYLEKTGKDFARGVCHSLWKSPQINWDGKLLGCSENRWVVFSEDVFEGDLALYYNNERIRYARQMLMGKKPPREDMPCLKCRTYEALKRYDKWITTDEIDNWCPPHERLFNVSCSLQPNQD